VLVLGDTLFELVFGLCFELVLGDMLFELAFGLRFALMPGNALFGVGLAFGLALKFCVGLAFAGAVASGLAFGVASRGWSFAVLTG